MLKEKNARIFLNNLRAVLETSLSLNLSDEKSTAVISSKLEQSYTCYGVSWEEYETLLTLLADENWCKISYLDGELKIVSPSENHELAKVKIRALLETYCDYKGIDYRAFGSTTLKKKDMASGKQPDESYSFDISKSIPQLAIEIIFSSGSLEDLNKYEKLGVKEVWFFRENQLEVYVYSPLACRYEKVTQSELLPSLDLKLVAKFMNKIWTGNLRLFKKEFVDHLIANS